MKKHRQINFIMFNDDYYEIGFRAYAIGLIKNGYFSFYPWLRHGYLIPDRVKAIDTNNITNTNNILSFLNMYFNYYEQTKD